MNDNLVQMIPMMVITVALAIPLFQMLRRTGKSMWWLLWVLLPFLGCIILLWIVAFSGWPVRKRDAIAAAFD